MTEVPLVLAAGTGALAVVNPCGFALLPVYASLLVVGDQPSDRLTALWRALLFTVAMTTGFVAVFGAFGLLVAPLAGTVQQHLPWVTIVLGALLMLLGGWLLAGRSLPFPALRLGRGRPVTRSFPSMMLFGAGYALASLSCTVGPFLVIVVSSFHTTSVGAGIAVFAAYAAGMGLVVGAVSLAVALARMSLVQWLRRTGRVVSRVAGGLMVVVGGYVAYYGWYEVRSHRAVVDDPVISAASRIQRALAVIVDRLGVGGVLAIFAALLLVAVLAGWLRHRTRATG